MSHDPLKTLLRIRRQAVDESRRTLVAALEVATIAAAAVRDAEQAIAQETERASRPDGSDQLVEAFAAWLPGARQRVAQASQQQDQCEANVACCRADLTACGAALEAIQQLCDTRLRVEREARGKKEAHQLDEVSAHLKAVGE